MNRSFDPLQAHERSRAPRHSAGRYRYVRRRWHLMFTVIDWVGSMIVAAGRRLRIRRNDPAKVRSDPTSILLLQLDHMGDAVITTGMLPHLAARFPQAAIDVLASRAAAPVFRAAPQIRRVHTIHHTRFDTGSYGRWLIDLLRWAWRLRAAQYDLVVDPRGEFPHAVLMRLAGIGRRVGFDSGGGGFLLTEVADYQPGRSEHDARRELLRVLGSAGDELLVPHLEPNDSARREVMGRLVQLLPGDRQRVVLHVGAGTQAKRWPMSHWASLAETILAQTSADIILVGDQRERTTGRHIRERCDDGRLIDWTAMLSFDELVALVSVATVVVSADSGPAHLAAACHAPVVVLMSGTNLAHQWRPAGRDVSALQMPVPCAPCHAHRCPMDQHPCMRELSPAMAWRELEPWLDSATEIEKRTTGPRVHHLEIASP